MTEFIQNLDKVEAVIFFLLLLIGGLVAFTVYALRKP